ncbi:predicted protein [Plenodomus lingam JN3]|uniref:Predicted protein n=1 Tax=Leptosphaeria maculans (strain JN3 / isolate v23.1.3 / race Av1-4-5-6-7-8) TaxID=985895 RepID=E4ZXS7_LEPMJ|nr:predicted protein [Plenodomus lingam JN3]CBX96172.1 predicted protein [Plenodomus lingam JN3]
MHRQTRRPFRWPRITYFVLTMATIHLHLTIASHRIALYLKLKPSGKHFSSAFWISDQSMSTGVDGVPGAYKACHV